MTLSLRPETAADEALLTALYASTREQELALTDWSAEQKRAFCEMQFQAQSKHYHEHYTGVAFCVIERDGLPVGRLYVARWAQEIRIMDITILPEHRGHGIGTHFLTALQTEAKTAGKTLAIHVEQFNPALRLYERLGFRQKEAKGVYWLMEWTALS